MATERNRLALIGVFDVLFSDSLFKEGYYKMMTNAGQSSEQIQKVIQQATNVNPDKLEEIKMEGKTIHDEIDQIKEGRKKKTQETAKIYTDALDVLNGLTATLRISTKKNITSEVPKSKNIDEALKSFAFDIQSIKEDERKQFLDILDEELTFILKNDMAKLEDMKNQALAQKKGLKGEESTKKTKEYNIARLRIFVKKHMEGLGGAKIKSKLKKKIDEVKENLPEHEEEPSPTKEQFIQLKESPEYAEIFDKLTLIGIGKAEEEFLAGHYIGMEPHQILERLKSIQKDRIQDVIVNKILKNYQIKKHLEDLPHDKQIDFTISLEERLDRKLISSDMDPKLIIDLVNTPIDKIDRKQKAKILLTNSGLLSHQLEISERKPSAFAKNKNIKEKIKKSKNVSVDPVSGYKMRKFE